MTYQTRPMKWAHCNHEGPLSDFTTEIEIGNEGAGEFLVLRQPFANTSISAGGIMICPTEWPTLRDAIEAAFAEIKKHEDPKP